MHRVQRGDEQVLAATFLPYSPAGHHDTPGTRVGRQSPQEFGNKTSFVWFPAVAMLYFRPLGFIGVCVFLLPAFRT
jgi:hypothetical protein